MIAASQLKYYTTASTATIETAKYPQFRAVCRSTSFDGRFQDICLARDESDREDLLREAVALRRRTELRLAGERETVVAGFFADGRLALYFGGDLMYQFDKQGRLRRAFADRSLFRAGPGCLSKLDRVRTPTETLLVRHDLTPEELNDFQSSMTKRLQVLDAALGQGTVEIIGCVPTDDDLREDLIDAIRTALASDQLLAPAVKGRR